MKISMSCAFEIDFQLENSFPQSKVINLKRWLGTWDNYWLMDASISLAFRPLVFSVMMAFEQRSTKVMTALLCFSPTIVSPSRWQQLSHAYFPSQWYPVTSWITRKVRLSYCFFLRKWFHCHQSNKVFTRHCHAYPRRYFYHRIWQYFWIQYHQDQNLLLLMSIVNTWSK